jgi:hypothetical protein
MVENITKIVHEYEVRVRSLLSVPRFSLGRRLLGPGGVAEGLTDEEVGKCGRHLGVSVVVIDKVWSVRVCCVREVNVEKRCWSFVVCEL